MLSSTSAVIYWLLCVLEFVIAADYRVKRITRYVPVRDAISGSVMCAFATNSTSSTTTIVVNSLLECSRVCSKNVDCARFNYKNYATSQRPQCQQFPAAVNRAQILFSVVDGCLLYQNAKAETWNISANGTVVLMQQHINGTLAFDKTWAEFKVGFGDPGGDYWIGNDRLHELTKDGRYKLRVDVQSFIDSQWYWAEYNTFAVHDESTNYTLHVGGYNGTAGDSMTLADFPESSLDGVPFSTKDRDNSGFTDFSTEASGGFWYTSMSVIFINSGNENYNGFSWLRPDFPDTVTGSNIIHSRMSLKWID